MNYQLLLNDQVLKSGDLKSLMSLFNGLSGNSFAKSNRASWLDKMSATESYQTYLNIMAKELKVDAWEGSLILQAADNTVEKAFLFNTHAKLKPTRKLKKAI